MITAFLAIGCVVESRRAEAAEAAHRIDTVSQQAVSIILALVNVFAALLVVRGLEASIALAAISRVRVDTAAMFAEARSQVTLVGGHLIQRSVPFRGQC